MRSLKIFWIMLLMMLATSSMVFAKAPEYRSDHQSFDVSSMQFLLDGNVVVNVSDCEIHADHAQVSVITQMVWAQDNITLKYGDDIFFSGDELQVIGPSRKAIIHGKIKFTRKNGLEISSREAQFSWDTKVAEFSNKVKVKIDKKTEKFQKVRYHVLTGEFLAKE